MTHSNHYRFDFAANSDPLLMTIEQTTAILNCGRTTVFKLLADEVLERRKIGRATRVTLRSIRQLAGC